jgi:biotin operon repressor
MEFKVLGPLRVVARHGVPIDLPSAPQRRLACLLVLRAGTVVSADALADQLALSAGALRTSVSRLRRVLGFATLVSVAPGYELRPDAVDAVDFERRLAVVDEAPGAPAPARRGPGTVARRRLRRVRPRGVGGGRVPAPGRTAHRGARVPRRAPAQRG